jgi:hypothetical protein
MKISNEQLQTVQENRMQRTAEQHADKEFNRILNREMENSAASGPDASGRIPASVHLQLLPSPVTDAAVGAAAELPAFSEEAAGMVESVLSELEGYAAQLGRAEAADLRTAFSSLRNMQDGINGFRNRFPGASGGPAGALIDELDVLAVTENFKFNRGDYL